MLNDITQIRQTKEYQEALKCFQLLNKKTGEITIDQENLDLWEKTIIDSPYRYFDNKGRQKAVLPNPLYIVSINDSESLSDKIKRLERGDSVGIQITPASYDFQAKIAGYNKRTGKPIIVYDGLTTVAIDELKESRRIDITVAELDETAALMKSQIEEIRLKKEQEAQAKIDAENATNATGETPPTGGATGGSGE